jgi:hypothetical protein
MERGDPPTGSGTRRPSDLVEVLAAVEESRAARHSSTTGRCFLPAEPDTPWLLEIGEKSGALKSVAEYTGAIISRCASAVLMATHVA